MTEAELDLIKRSVVEAFADTPRPDLSGIHPLGCCEEHEEDYEWYRSHSVQEFMDILPSQWLDPIDFSSLRPPAYHYFVPGILLAVLESARDPDGPSWREKDWLDNLIPFEDRAEYFKSEYLSLFTPRQRRAVVDYLRFAFDDVLTEDDEPDEMAGRITYNEGWLEVRHGEVPEWRLKYERRVEFAINQIWPDETSAMSGFRFLESP